MASSGDEEARGCPFCEQQSCEHQLIWSSVYNDDWGGPLADASEALFERLKDATVAALLRGRSSLDGSHALATLLDRAQSYVDDFGLEALAQFPSSFIRAYWLNLGAETDDVALVQYDFDGAGPGTGETYRDLYGREPAAAIEALLDAAEADLRRLEVLVPGRRRPRSRK